MQRLCAVSVDLDAIRHYYAIHGLVHSPEAEDPVLMRAVGRLADWARQAQIPLTWFVVGCDLDHEPYAANLLELSRSGHELANHTFHHYYDLTRRGRAVMHDEVLQCSERISQLTGMASHGFRAPGYVVTDELDAVLAEIGVAYDSSLFPCPIYYAAKLSVLCGQRLFGRQSRAVVGPPRDLAAGTRPHRTQSGILELPIQVTQGLRLPFIGTTLTLLHPTAARFLTRGVLGEPLVNLELHGIDALDAGDGLADLARVQPDLRTAWCDKLDRIGRVLQILRRADYRFVTLLQAAQSASWVETGRTG